MWLSPQLDPGSIGFLIVYGVLRFLSGFTHILYITIYIRDYIRRLSGWIRIGELLSRDRAYHVQSGGRARSRGCLGGSLRS